MSQSAVVLTDDEWKDLAYVAVKYEVETRWVIGRTDDTEHLEGVRRRRALCQRIIEASRQWARWQL